jgi:catechol 2,3-dioxygenase-like lactoylglutathione lyase family enzyme
VRARGQHPHHYVLSGLEQSEIVFLGPDNVNVLLVGARNYSPEMARPGIAGDFSAVTVVSQFVADFEASARFYRDGLGLEQVFDVWTDEQSRPVVNEMVGIPSHADVRLAAYRTPGNPDGKVLLLATRGVEVKSLVERMRPDHLGVVLLSHATDDLDSLRARLPEFGGEIVTEPAEIAFAPHVRTRSFLARAPRGVLLEFYEEA